MKQGLNIVAIGGGTGLSTLLRGLKTFVGKRRNLVDLQSRRDRHRHR